MDEANGGQRQVPSEQFAGFEGFQAKTGATNAHRTAPGATKGAAEEARRNSRVQYW
jgi:hypothetical protein